MQSFFETVHYCDEWRKFTSVSHTVSQSYSQSVSHSVNFPGGVGYYVCTIYVCSDLLCFEGYLGNFSCFISLRSRRYLGGGMRRRERERRKMGGARKK